MRRRGREQKTPWIVVAFSVTGPVLFLVGVFAVLYAAHDPKAEIFAKYAQAVSYWESTGFFNFQKDFHTGATHLLLNHSVVPPSDLQTGFVEPRSFRLNLNISNVQTSLAGHSSDLPPYTAVMWFNGSMPIWPVWNGKSDELTSAYVIIAPFVGNKTTSFQFSSYTCTDVRVPVHCSKATPVPKSPPPPAPFAPFMPPAPPAPPTRPSRPPLSLTEGRRRRLLSSSGSKCAKYYRKISFLTEVGVLAIPPTKLVKNVTHWGYVADKCAVKYTTYEQQITEEEYEADTGLDFALWCHNWNDFFTGPSGATVTVRSVQDPYAVAGNLTNCTMEFGSTPRHLTTVGVGLMLPGLMLSIMAYFCIAGACSPQDFGLDGDLAPLVGGAGGKPPPRAYGATTSTAGTVEMQGGGTARRMLDARMM